MMRTKLVSIQPAIAFLCALAVGSVARNARCDESRLPNIVIGLSDHQNGIALAPVAYALGARVIEKHFTLNRAWKGTDHAFSLEPVGMSKMVRDLHRVREALGDGVKRVYEREQPIIKKLRRVDVVAK